MQKKGRVLVAAEKGFVSLIERLDAKQKSAADRRKLRRRAHQAQGHVCILRRPAWVPAGDAFEEVDVWLPALANKVKAEMLAGGWPADMFTPDKEFDLLYSVTQCPLCRDFADDPAKVMKGPRRHPDLSSGVPTQPAPATPAAAEPLNSEDDDSDYDVTAVDADDTADGEEAYSDDTDSSGEDSDCSHLSYESGEEDVGTEDV